MTPDCGTPPGYQRRISDRTDHRGGIVSELSEFLLDRIRDDEEAARAASPGPWHVDIESATVLAVDDIEVCDGFALSGPQLRATTAHIARHDPARVLAECEARRALVEELARMERDEVGWDGIEQKVMRYLALPFASHPDYRSEWAP